MKSGSLLADYDGPGPLIYLAFAAFIAVAPWRYAPLAGVALSVMFIIGGVVDPGFRDRLVTPTETIDFGGGWLQILAFAAAIVFGLAPVWSTLARHRRWTTGTTTAESDSRQEESLHDECNDLDR